MVPPTAPLFCVCWSCDGLCGGSGDANSCGPAERNVDGRHICAVCRGKADVIGEDFTGAQATIRSNFVRLEVDTFGRGEAVWLTAASARELARVLAERARQLEDQDAAPAPRPTLKGGAQ